MESIKDMFENMKHLLISLLPYLVCLILGMFLWKGCNEINTLREQNERLKCLNSEMVEQIDQVKSKNDSLLNEVDYFTDEISSLESQLKKAKIHKETIVERVKYVEVTNDTIRDLMLLNQANDTIIRNLEKISSVKDSIILKQNLVIQNDSELQDHLKSEIEQRNSQIMQMNKELRTEKKKKIFWQCTTASLLVIAALT